MFVIIAHRGWSGAAPENTMPAFELARRHGFGNVELDVQLTADGVPVVFHDATLERTTNGYGRLQDSSWADLRQLDAGSWFGEQYSGAPVPSLAEVIDRYADTMRLHVELKSEQPELPAAVFAVVAKRVGVALDPFAIPGITITSFHLRQLQLSLAMPWPTTPAHHWLTMECSRATVVTASLSGVSGLCPPACQLTPELVDQIRALGLGVRAHSVRSQNDLRRAVHAGADGATVDSPDAASAVLGDG